MSNSKPSAAYLASLSLGCLSLTFVTVSLTALYQVWRHANPLEALNTPGLTAFIACLTLISSSRVIFMPRVSLILKTVVRIIIVAALSFSFFGFFVSIAAIVWQHRSHQLFLPIWAASLGGILQVSTAIWLIKYRGE